LLGVAWASAGQPIQDVFHLPPEDGRPGAVLVPPALVDRLRAGGGIAPAPPAIVLTEASYAGRPDGPTARFRARFRIFAFSPGPTTLPVPITGIRVRSATLDGADPADLQPVTDGLRVPVSGSGPHTLELEFTAAVVDTGTEREVKFSVPEVLASTLTFA